ncbi:hypothetical protein AURDEDRAFT_172015 [Auricularia subglabra TFB-10046 SS5]|nr:hypothetical protein AURDEDRAFT_172015 [Auricularia subglabra TFB-10046 SS5]
MAQPLLLQKERLGLNAVVHTTLQIALERGVREDQVPALLAEIRVALDNAISHIASELGVPPPTAPQPPIQAPVIQAPAPAQVSYVPQYTPPPVLVAPPPPPQQPAYPLTPAPSTVSSAEPPPAPAYPTPVQASVPRAPARPLTPTGPRGSRNETPNPSAGTRRIIIKRGPLKVAGVTLGKDVLLNIFNRLLAPAHAPFQREGRFTLLLKASHVCSEWRRVVLTEPCLWTRLAGLSFTELLNFRELIYRSYPLPLDVDLDLNIPQKYKNQTVFIPLANEMARVRTLKLTLNPTHTLAWNSVQDALTRPAPLLQSFEFEFTPGFRLPDTIFGGHAPMLTWVALDPEVLPVMSSPEGLRKVKSFDARVRPQPLFEAHTRRIFTACPLLKTLFLSHVVADAHEQTQSALSTGVPAPDSVARFYSFSRNLDHLELVTPDGINAVPTLFLLNHKHIAYIHVRRAIPLLFEFLRKRVGPVRNLSVVGDSRVALRDDRKFERVFSDTAPPALEGMLQYHGLYAALESLTLWELVSEPALRIIQGQRMPELRKLSVLVRRPERFYGRVMHLFEALKRKPWDLPRLRTLRFTAEDVSGAFPFAAGSRPSIHARAVRDFVRDGLRVGFWDRRLKEVVMDGVDFVEGLRSYEVEALRDFVQEIEIYSRSIDRTDAEPNALLSAIRVALLHAVNEVVEHWQAVVALLPSLLTPPSTPPPSTRPIVEALSDENIVICLSHLPTADLLHAAATCKRWRAVALHTANADYRVRLRRAAEDRQLTLSAVDALSGKAVDLHFPLLEHNDLLPKHVRLLRPTSGAVHHVLAALPSEPYYMCFHEDAPGRCSFAVETREKHIWLHRSDAGMRLLGGSVRRLTVPWTMSYKRADGMTAVNFPQLKKLTVVVRADMPARGLQKVLRSNGDRKGSRGPRPFD